MFYIIIILLAVIVLLLLWQPSRERVKILFMTKSKKEKEERKKKILEILKNKEKVDNEEIRKSLGIAARTAVKYCDELEKEGKIEQVGKTGRSVFYKIK